MAIEELLTSDEVAKLARVHPSTVLRWAQSGRIPAVVLGDRSYRFRVSDVEKFLSPAPVPSDAEVAS